MRVRFGSIGARRFGRIAIDVALSGTSFLLAAFLCQGAAGFDDSDVISRGLLVFLGVCAAVYLNTGLHMASWRFASISDFFVMSRDVLIAVVAFGALNFILSSALPINVPITAAFIMVTLMGGMRALYRFRFEGGSQRTGDAGGDAPMPILAYGATAETDTLLRSLGSGGTRAYKVVGIIDDDPASRDRCMRGVKVLGRLSDLRGVLARLDGAAKPSKLVLPAGGVPRQKLREIVDTVAGSGLRAVRIPNATDLLKKASDAFAFEPICVTDLLGREPVALRLDTIDRLIHGKSVVVTGGGGSIGSELCRHLLRRNPSKLVIIDHCEFNLFKIERELFAIDRHRVVQPVLASVRDREKIEKIFREAQVDLVFHAAAYKHVPLVEMNPAEGVLTNMVGASHVADAAAAVGAAAMIMVSTDKAVKPSNTMGMSKRLAEAYCQAMDMDCAKKGLSTRFMVVRFGNVLGSSGSVVPTFEQQIKRGGPVTVTDPAMTRYFMTIPEAVELVLQGAAFGVDHTSWAGAILVLDMGEPVAIVDLARRMISLAGLVPDKDIKIEFTGVRSGEKLHEELFDENETLETTDVPGIRLARSLVQDLDSMRALRDELAEMGPAGDANALTRLVRAAIAGNAVAPVSIARFPRGADRQKTDESPLRTVEFASARGWKRHPSRRAQGEQTPSADWVIVSNLAPLGDERSAAPKSRDRN